VIIKEIFRRWRRYQQIVRELECYSNGELTELGIAAADIGRIAAMVASEEYPVNGRDGVRNVIRGRSAIGFNAAYSQKAN
jgi:uncharacterized protein YjiS (DUF1127 family)